MPCRDLALLSRAIARWRNIAISGAIPGAARNEQQRTPILRALDEASARPVDLELIPYLHVVPTENTRHFARGQPLDRQLSRPPHRRRGDRECSLAMANSCRTIG